MTTLNLNQREQVAIKGQLDLQISRSGILSGVIDASQTDDVVAGQSAKLYASNTGAEVKFVAAAATDVAIGLFVRDIQKSSMSAGDAVQVAGSFGPVMWLEAAETVTPGERVEVSSTGTVQAVSAGKCRGIVIDYATVGNLTRVILTTPDTALS
jgi:hypothetical protein